MKPDFSPDRFDLETAAQTQVADLVQTLLEKLNQAATEIQSKDEKIQALTFELAYLRRIRYGVKSEAFSQLQWDLVTDTWNEDVAAVEAEIGQLAHKPSGTDEKPNRQRAGRQPLPGLCRASNSAMSPLPASVGNVAVTRSTSVMVSPNNWMSCQPY